MALALALKYRPIRFGDLVGQESVSQTLSMALDNSRISHAYLFSGLRGSGKTSSARIFARALQCEKGPTSTPCDVCDNCKAALEGRHIDVIEMDAASSRKIDDVRDLIEQTKYRPAYGRYKIFIVDEVHMLTKEAFNALLKTLEEPPPYVKFILATTDPLKLPATILSRTQHFRFKKIPHKSVVSHVGRILEQEGVSYEPRALEIIARSGSGSLRDTLTLTDQAINFCNKHVTTSKVVEMLGVVDPQTLRGFFEAIFARDENRLQEILALLEEYECEMIIDEMMLFLKEALRVKDKDFPLLVTDRFLRILSESKYLLGINTDGGFVLLLMSLKMSEAMKVRDVDSMIKELEANLSLAQTHPTRVAASDTASSHAGSVSQISPVSAPTPSPAQEVRQDRAREDVLFDRLKAKVYDRNKELGEAFEKNFKILWFDGSRLNLGSLAQGDERAFLLKNWPILKTMIQEIYGPQISIEFSRLLSPSEESPVPQGTKTSSIISPQEAKEIGEIQDSEEFQESQKFDESDPPAPPGPVSPSKENKDVSPASPLPGADAFPQAPSERSPQEVFLEENKEIVKSIKTHLGATQMIVLDGDKW